MPGDEEHRSNVLRGSLPGVAYGLLAAWSSNSYQGSAMAGDLDAFCASAAAVLGSRATVREAIG